MTNRERVRATLGGRPAESGETGRFPVTAVYNMLYHMDHYAELTGEPQWRFERWRASTPEEYVATFRRIHEKVPFELLQPLEAPPREWRERQEFVERDGRPFRHDTKTGEWAALGLPTAGGHAFDDTPNETRRVFDRKDADEQVSVRKAEEAIRSGANDYLEAVVREFGRDEFVLSGGVVGALYSCSWYVGMTNLFAMLVDAPDLVEHLCSRILEQNVETIRRLAAGGGDAVYIDDATATSDMISPAHYERFSLPYTRPMVDEIHRLGLKAIVVYYGGVADRLDLIAATGADGLVMEASMKGYVNDVAETVDRIGERVTVFANVDPVGVIQNGSDDALDAEIRRQCLAGARARGFVVSIPSPITPETPLARVQRFIERAKAIGAEVRAAGAPARRARAEERD